MRENVILGGKAAPVLVTKTLKWRKILLEGGGGGKYCPNLGLKSMNYEKAGYRRGDPALVWGQKVLKRGKMSLKGENATPDLG